MKIVITPRSFREAGEDLLLRFRAAGYEVVLNETGKTLTEEQMEKFCAGADGLLVGIDPVTRRVLEGAPRLKAISKYGAGLDNIDLVAAHELGIQVERAVGTNAVSVAELAVGLFFVLARGIVPAALCVRNGGWERTKGVELFGKTAGILGLGSIGRETARMAKGLGMRIIAYDPVVNADDAFVREHDIELLGMEDVIRRADFLTLHLPLMEHTKGLVNDDRLKMMKPSAFLVNTSRGELIDEEALYDVLAAGKLAGAASDVFSKEPPDSHPLLTLRNFTLTPHIGAYTEEANRKMAETAWENLLNMLRERDNHQ